MSLERWPQIPLLSRRDVQEAGQAIHAERIPEAHGRTYRTLTGGSTGQPVATIGTRLTAYAWQAFALRDHFWHQRDFTRKLGCIRHMSAGSASPPDGKTVSNWGSAVSPYVNTGPGAVLAIESTVNQQFDWLLRQRPDYLFGYPSCIAALARQFRLRGESLDNLREVRTFGEVVEPHVRELCHNAWDTELVDLYSTQELGYIALQCPAYHHYHVQEESVYLEVLAPDGRPCGPGEVGKVVITSLHNYAMPLIRYDLGDYAEVGDTCPCGRTLLTLNRILGRQRNMLVLPNGDTVWPALTLDQRSGAPPELTSIRQMQVVQTSVTDLEVNLVTEKRLTDDGESRLKQFIVDCLPRQFNISILYVDNVARSPSRKFEDFRCDVRAM